jgi:hypothetical protein
MPYPWVEVDCGFEGYRRELWCARWKSFIQHFYKTNVPYDYNGSKIYWVVLDEELGKTMTTIWSLEAEGYRTSYQSKSRTFFWVDSNYYRQNSREIIQWAERYRCKMPSCEYGWIEMPNERVETLFRLQWAGNCYG